MVTPRKRSTPQDWAHQAKEFRIGREKRKRYLNWPMRSGKTKAVIDKACYQYEKDRVMGVLVLAPNGVHLNWAQNEIPKWSWPELGDMRVFAWSTPRRGDWDQVRGLEEICTPTTELRWFCVNMEALKEDDNKIAIRKFLNSLPQNESGRRKLMLVVSEAHHFGHPGAKRTYQARSLSLWAEFVTEESGTPVLNSPLRAFSQYEVLEEKALGFATFSEFKKEYAVEIGIPNTRRTRVVSYKNLPNLTKQLAKWTSTVVREDIHDMPPLLRVERPVIMSEAQRRAYNEMVEHHLIEIEGVDVDAEDAGARMAKLQQIINGYLMKDGQILTVDDDAPIYDALLEQVDGTLPGKTLIWCRFKEDIRRCLRKLTKVGYRCVQYHGDVPLAIRERDRKLFNSSRDLDIMLGQPQAGGEGLDFSGADAVIYFSCLPNTITMVQSEERATVVGGKAITIVRLRTHGTVDDRLWEIVDGNIALADVVSGRGLRDLLRETKI
jgi:hypothetical protein